ncbi:DinB family protein [Pontibacter oryzae]|uniref:DinB family protein n=1 Tax=Pontibacter oryzae TaxID=2304593 RepID=A0A399SHV4_9BACT|nr:DinB family protein [Pontibacter oryzae]RIJ41437.1 DinB family protein [Pontibacter oryzae]
MDKDKDQQLREQLVNMMQTGQAFRPRQELLAGITLQEASEKVKDLPYTLWQLLEHMRFAQHDILNFCRNPDYKEPTWPDDYWPKNAQPPSEGELQQTLQALTNDLHAMVSLVQDTNNDLFTPIPHGDGQTLLREAMLMAEHSAYHLGEIIVLRRLLGNIK